MRIILCSKSDVKESLIKKWFSEKFKVSVEVEKIFIKYDILPPQPIGDDIKLICLKKINDIKDNYSNIDYIISIENFIDVLEDMIKYRLCMCVYKYDTKEYITKVNEGVNLGIDVMYNFSNFLSIMKDLKNSYINTSKNYIFNGCEDKLCDLVNKYYSEIPKSNFIRFLKDSKYDKLNQFSSLLEDIFIV
jgi:hypothetical protein